VGRALLRFRRVGRITLLAIEAEEGVILPEGEDRVIIARDGYNNNSHGDRPFVRNIVTISHGSDSGGPAPKSAFVNSISNRVCNTF
jgi:hypothetical protein